jgi:hypothetical protein
LGTHANSDILVTFPPGAKTFQAQVGIDNNRDTRGTHGSVHFSVELGGQQVFRSDTLRGGNVPVAVNIDLPPDARELVLKVDTTPDGPAHDQADWADAHLVMADGRTLWLDEQEQSFLGTATPFSFDYGGAASGEVMKNCPRTVETQDEKDCLWHTVTCGGLGMRCYSLPASRTSRIGHTVNTSTSSP